MKTNLATRLLLRVGFVRRKASGELAWPLHVPPRERFMYYWKCDRKPYLFRNLPHVIKWTPGRLLPRRWGGGWLGFEFGDRG